MAGTRTGPHEPGTPVIGLGTPVTRSANTPGGRDADGWTGDNTLAGAIDDAATPIVKAEDVSIADANTQFTGDTVEEALDEALDYAQAHVADTTAAHAATAVSVTPAGSIAATTVQAALEEVAGDYVTADTALMVAHNVDLASDGSIHGFKGIKKVSATGASETSNVDEIQTLTLTAGLVDETFKLTFNGNESNAVTLPAGGYANVTAAQIKAALITISDWTTKTADIAVVKNANDYAITFSGTLGRTDIGAITVTSKTGAADGSVAETLKGVAGTQYTVAGIAVGDWIQDSIVFATAASIGTAVIRAGTDFRFAEAGKVDVMANPVDNSNNQVIIEYIDLT